MAGLGFQSNCYCVVACKGLLWNICIGVQNHLNSIGLCCCMKVYRYTEILNLYCSLDGSSDILYITELHHIMYPV